MRKDTLCVSAAAVLCAAAGACGQWTENFDSYPAGALSGNGGWALWCTGGSDGLITTALANSAPHSFRADAGTDMVQEFAVDSGVWTMEAEIYVPSDAGAGDGYYIVMNQYCPGDNSFWSVVIVFSNTSGLVQNWQGNVLALITDQWVNLRIEIDLDADTMDQFYDGQVLGAGMSWSGNVALGGAQAIAALDLFSDSLNGIHYDDLSLLSADCYADFNDDGTVNTLDFLAYLNAFSNGDPAADCNDDGTVNTLDFLCFLNAFNAGCE